MRPQTLAVLIASTVTAIFVGALGIVALSNFMPPSAPNGPNAKQAQVAENFVFVPGDAGGDGPQFDFGNPPPFDGVPQAAAPIQPAELPKVRGPVVPAKDYAVSGPHTHGNLSVFLIHGEDQAKNLNIITLQEGIDNGHVIVHETRGMQLMVDNRSNNPLFIQAGDIVKGGTQDRTLPFDMLIAANSRNNSVGVLCVEQGRSFPRDGEISTSFASSTEQLPGRKLRLAAHSNNQSLVWNNVKTLQQNLARTTGGSVQAEKSTSSLQLSLEHPRVQGEVRNYLTNLGSVIEDKNDVIGYAVAVNGKIQGADVYATNALFQKLWPKLLRASAVDALAERRLDAGDAPSADDVKALLAQAETGTPSRVNGLNRGVTIRHDSAQHLLFDTCDPTNANLVLHRSFLVK
jgi:ARG/rhodanese/phosphatase superfamily protein